MERSTRDSLVGLEQFTSQGSLSEVPQLARNEAHVWMWNLNVGRSFQSYLESQLSDCDWIRVRGLRSGEDARRYVVRRGMVRSILGRYLDLPPQAFSFAYSDFGKPSLEHRLKIHLEFNVSDSFDLAALAVSAGHALGIDIERLRPFPKGIPAATSLMSRLERKRVGLVGGSERNRVMFQAWTRFEAVAKAEGVGIHTLHGDLIQRIPTSCRVQQRDGKPDSYHHTFSLTDLAMPTGYVGALAAPKVVDKVVVFPDL